MGSFYNDHCYFLPAMAGWFIFSALLSSYNKVVFGKDRMDFPCPLLMTSVHFFIQMVFSYTVSSACPDRFGSTVKSMPWYTYLITSLPCGLVTSFDVGLSNLSLVRISISFYTMVKASAPIFVLISAYLFKIEKITWNLIGVVGIICVGEVLTVEGELEFDLIGFLLCSGAAVLSGVRWTTVQFTIQNLDPPMKTSIETMRLLSPFMFLSMLIISFCVEKPWSSMGAESDKNYFVDREESLKTVGMAVLGGTLAVCMISCELWLIMQSSAVIMMIGGVCKEVTTIFVGVIFFGDAVNTTNLAGCTIIFSGVVLYKLSYQKQKKDAEGPGKLKIDYRPVKVNMLDENVQMKNLMADDGMKDHVDADETSIDTGLEMSEFEDMVEEMDGDDKWGGIDRLRDQLGDETDIENIPCTDSEEPAFYKKPHE